MVPGRLSFPDPGRVAQRESARFTRGRSLVRSQPRPFVVKETTKSLQILGDCYSDRSPGDRVSRSHTLDDRVRYVSAYAAVQDRAVLRHEIAELRQIPNHVLVATGGLADLGWAATS